MKTLQKLAKVFVALFAVVLAGCAGTAARTDLLMRTESLAPAVLPVDKTASAEPTFSGGPAASGEQLLSEAVTGYPDLAPVLKENGTPDAVEIDANRFDLYYRNPRRTLVYEQTSDFSDFRELMDLNVVPHSVERLGFQEASTPAPWPVTITPAQAEVLGAPKLPDPPVGDDPASFASKYRKQAEEFRARVREIREGQSYDRANKALARLNPAAVLPGFDWRIVLVQSSGKQALLVPDGTIFISDGLVSSLSDDELTAIVAHLMGHEAYGDGRDWWTEAGPVKTTLAVVGLTVLAVAAVAVLGGGGGNMNTPPPSYVGYSEKQEIDADYMAVRFLAAADIPPGKLFDAMSKLSSPPCQCPQVPGELLDFSTFHHAGRDAADLGKLLDAGIIRSQERAPARPQVSLVE